MELLADIRLDGQLVTVEDQTSPGTLTPHDKFNAIWAVNYQLKFHYQRSPWVEHGYSPPCFLQELPKGVAPPVGTWHCILLDTAYQAGVLGYHTDEAGNNIPFAEVFVKTARDDGVDFAEVLSHEALEMIVDPHVENAAEIRKVLNTEKDEYYIVELGDPVEGRGYDVGAPEGHKTGVIVADFVYPLWFNLGQTRPATSFAEERNLSPRLEPFVLARGGYQSVAPKNEPDNWHSIYGESRSKRPAWSSRLIRIHA